MITALTEYVFKINTQKEMEMRKFIMMRLQ